MKRPTGLKYNIKAINKGWFKSGENRYERKKGTENYLWLVPPKGTRRSPKTEFKKGNIPHNYKGDAVGYHALHRWIRRRFGKPLLCEFCGRKEGRLEWANKTYNYLRERDDWMTLCKRCHARYDYVNGWGVATAKFPGINACVS